MIKRKKVYVALIAVFVLLIVSLITCGIFLDVSGVFNGEIKDVQSSSARIEIIPFEDEVYLVGDAVEEWTKGNMTATEIYNNYSSSGRLYTSRGVIVNYAIYGLSSEIAPVSQFLELSQEKTLANSKKIEIPPSDRKVQLDYLFVDTYYYFRVTATLSDGKTVVSDIETFKTAKTPRIIELENLRNIRDFGGAVTVDGKRVKQGVLYRGCELDGAIAKKYTITEDGIRIMKEVFGIKTDLDLRSSSTENVRDMLGEDVLHKHYSFLAYSECFTSDHAKTKMRELFTELAKADNYPAYIHCSYGADRTGTACYFLGALLGMSEEDLYRDWEVSILCNGGAFYEDMEKFLVDYEALEGNTVREKAENYFLSIGVTKDQIESIRNVFLEDNV